MLRFCSAGARPATQIWFQSVKYFCWTPPFFTSSFHLLAWGTVWWRGPQHSTRLPLRQVHIVASGSQNLSAPGPKSCGEFDPATEPLLRTWFPTLCRRHFRKTFLITSMGKMYWMLWRMLCQNKAFGKTARSAKTRARRSKKQKQLARV